jgi:hypothetical protein
MFCTSRSHQREGGGLLEYFVVEMVSRMQTRERSKEYFVLIHRIPMFVYLLLGAFHRSLDISQTGSLMLCQERHRDHLSSLEDHKLSCPRKTIVYAFRPEPHRSTREYRQQKGQEECLGDTKINKSSVIWTSVPCALKSTLREKKIGGM